MKKPNGRIIFIIALCVLISLAFSCESGSDIDHEIYVYKTKADYSKNVCIELNSDKSQITSFYGPNEVNKRWPVVLIDGYFLNGTFGPNSGFLSITNEVYNKNYYTTPVVDSLYKLLLEKDPFIEFYEFNDTKNVFYSERGAYGIDTAYINYLIKENDLEKYFIRVK